jgi:spore maturation protein CgeB
MVSERTSELMAMFRDGAEAAFFSSTHELVSVVHALLREPERRSAMARAGRARVQADGHSVDGRVRDLLTAIGRSA